MDDCKQRIIGLINSAQEWFDWWMSDKPVGDKDEAQLELELTEY